MPPKEGEAEGIKALRELAARLRAVRRHYELTQQEFARRLGVSRSHLSEVEVNQAKPATDILIGIPRAFPEISAEWLLTGAGPMTAGVPAEARDLEAISELATRTAMTVMDLINQQRKHRRGFALSDEEVSTLLLLIPQVFRTAYFAAMRRPGTTHNDALRTASEKANMVGKALALP